jgi:hypothetical protein
MLTIYGVLRIDEDEAGVDGLVEKSALRGVLCL